MRNVLLRDSDVMSMAHSLELRVPFLDHRVVESVVALPGEYKLNGGGPKALLTDATAGLLPRELIDRPKMGFTMPFEDWLRQGLGQEVGRALEDPDFGGGVAEALDAEAVRGVWADFRSGTTQWTRPWALFALKSWGERHLSR
jgi:asparagine synthase (glutamine-hydrolysing)